ncbi:unnamed protein product [Rotaria magnacalcarata]|uniref:Uncharacterized protein n=1 Tax=Rotaria magnacalcarata TaxID=392030 RepID=A0A816MRV4_9BILA|nr:unnamed protein product [Rotaria magnacalcarata]
MSSPSNNPSESVTNSEHTDSTIEINSSSTDRSTCHIAAGINNIQCSTTVQGQNGLWSKPYPPIDRSGYVDDHDRPFFLYHKQNATEISENKNFSLPASYEPWVKGKKGSNKLQLNVRKLAISGFSNVSKDLVKLFIIKTLNKKNKKIRYICISNEINSNSIDPDNIVPKIHIQIVFFGQTSIYSCFLDEYLGCRCEYRVTHDADAWNEFIKKGLNFVEYGLFKGEKKNGPPLMWSQFKKSSLDNETAAQLITSVEDNVGDIMVDFAFKAPRNAIKGYTGFALSLPGKPNHCRGYRSRDNWDDEADYIVLDDVPWNKIAKRGFLDKEDLITGQAELVAKEKYSKNKTIQTKKPAIVLLNPAAAKSFLELLEKKNDNNADFWRERSFVYVMGADEYFFKPKVIEGPLDTVTYTVDGVPLFDAYRRAWREDKEGTAAAVTVISEEEEEEENQESLSTASPAALSKATQTSNCIEEECNNQADMESVPSEQFEYYS